jgi:hypothetical protein
MSIDEHSLEEYSRLICLPDALGREIRVGDKVAHVTRQGSNVRITARQITCLNIPKQAIKMDHSNSWAKPYNVLRID